MSISKKKLLIFIPSIEDGGVEKNLFIILNYLKLKIKDIHLVTFDKSKKNYFSKQIKIINPILNFSFFKGRYPKYILCLLLLIKIFVFDRNYLVLSFQANIYVLIISKIFNLRVISRSNSSSAGWNQNLIKQFIFSYFLKKADKIIVNSVDFKREMDKKFSINSCCILNPFLFKKIKKDSNVKVKLNKALSNGDFKSAVGIMRSVSPEIATEFVDVIQPMLKKMGEDLRKAGHTFTAVDNYFPRLVKDYDKYSASWGKIKAGKIDEALESYAKRKGTVTNLLSGDEKSKVIDLTMRGYRQTTDGWQPPNVKQRQFESLTDDQVQFYADPEEALSMYIRNSIHDIEKRKFFGRTAVQDKLGGFDTDTSIGAVVQKAMKDGDITKEQQQELVELLKARFVGGEQAMGSLTSNVRNLGYMGTIANSISAITQLADVGIASSLKGFRNSIGSMFGTKQLTLIDIGLDDVITKELANGDPRLTARALNKLMSLALFKYTDKLGKETFMNAAFKKAQQMVKSEKGEAAFRKKAGKLYGDELESLVADLKSGEITENVKFFAFNELSDVQPVSLMEMPEGYLNMKGGRLLYMLKSFTLKQFDIVRREVIQQWQRGEKTEAVKNAALLAGYISASQTGISVTKDFILGREVKPEDIPDKALWGLMGVFGMNEYTYDKYLKQGKFKEAGFNYLAPATPIFEAALTLGMELPKDDPNIEPAMKAVPLVGPFLYNWVGGGAEKANERREDKRRDKRMGN